MDPRILWYRLKFFPISKSYTDSFLCKKVLLFIQRSEGKKMYVYTYTVYKMCISRPPTWSIDPRIYHVRRSIILPDCWAGSGKLKKKYNCYSRTGSSPGASSRQFFPHVRLLGWKNMWTVYYRQSLLLPPLH